jgi:hypothetical protein
LYSLNFFSKKLDFIQTALYGFGSISVWNSVAMTGKRRWLGYFEDHNSRSFRELLAMFSANIMLYRNFKRDELS